MGVIPQHLERHTQKGKTYVSLRYSLQMQMQEVGTTYFIKAWSWTAPWKKGGRVLVVLRSRAHERAAVFETQQISENLSMSYALGPGTQKSDASQPSKQQASSIVPANRPQTSVMLAAQFRELPAASPQIIMDPSPRLQIQGSPSEGNFRYTIGEKRNNGGMLYICLFQIPPYSFALRMLDMRLPKETMRSRNA